MKTAMQVNFEVEQPQAANTGGGPAQFHFCITALEFFDF